MNRIKINKIMSYIKGQNEFPFDVFDVEEDYESALEYYRICVLLDDDEETLVRAELLGMAERAQTAEIVRLASVEPVACGGRRKKREKLKQSVGIVEWLKSLPVELQKSFFASLAKGGGAVA